MRTPRASRWLLVAITTVITVTLTSFACAPDPTSLTGPGDQAPSLSVQGRQQGLETAIAAQQAHASELFAISGVVGTAVGVTADGRPSVLVFTRAAGTVGIPPAVGGVPVRVEATGPFTAIQAARKGPGGAAGGKPGHVDPTSRFTRPVPIGVSTGNAGECSAGTISARVKSGSSVFALSNNHVYALENHASIGSEVLQPGRYDTNCSYDSNNHLGTLSAFKAIVFSSSANNTIDAALASTTTNDLGKSTPSDGYGTPNSTTVAAVLGQAVAKYGRTTSQTTGSITGIHATILVGYSTGTAQFVDQIIVQSRKAFIKAGDSGSLLVTNDANANPVGLLFAGNQSGNYAVANRIDLVLSYFGVSIDGK